MKKKRRNKILKKEIVLFALARVGEVTLEKLLDVLAGSGEMMSAMMTTSKKESARALMEATTRDRGIRIDLVSKAAIYSMVSRLTKEGLISKDGKKISATKKGIDLFSKKQVVPLKKLPNGKHVLVIFDIPESPKGRRNRQWIRDELVNMGFEMIQKSVWMGSVIIPKSFIKEIYELKLNDFVHILEVTKQGTLN